jgi:hypothetical protein
MAMGILCMACGPALPSVAQERAAPPAVIDLAGLWRFTADPGQEGVRKEFFNRELAQRIRLPGSTDEAHFGVPNRSKPTLDGLYRPFSYAGPAWYQRDVEIPEAWRGKRLTVFVERAHGQSRLWLDADDCGTQQSLIAPQVFELGTRVQPGPHRLTIVMDNSLKLNLGPFPSIRYEGTQTNWNGLVGRLELRACDPLAIDDVQVYPDVEHRTVRVRLTVANLTGRPVEGTLKMSVAGRAAPELSVSLTATVARTIVGDDSVRIVNVDSVRVGPAVPPRTVSFTAAEPRTIVNAELPLGEGVKLWDEFSPALYDLRVELTGGGKVEYHDSQTAAFGMRQLAARGTQLVMNGRPIFLRGTLECAIFPRTGYPPADVQSWRRIYRVLKSYGLNFMRFHSWCPPEAAFAAADLEGVMLQAEGPIANTDVGKDPARDAFLEAEFQRMTRTYGNHPSFCLMTLGNEYGGSAALLARWIDMLRGEDPRHLYSSPSAGQTTPNRQFTEGGPRGIHGPGTETDFRKQLAAEDRPLVGHEIGQWTFFPNFDEIAKYTGVLAARNFELVRDDLTAKHMLDLAPRFCQATGKQAVLLYKEEIEVLLRTPGYTAFSLLDMHDYPGQGTALIGPLDPFWDSKGFVLPEVHRRYCGPTVPLVRLKKRTFTVEEPLAAEAELANFGPIRLRQARFVWRLATEQGQAVATGELPTLDVPTGKLAELGSIRASLAAAPAPCKLILSLALEGTDIANEWDVWVYPSGGPPPAPAGVTFSRQWDSAAKSALAHGRRVLLVAAAPNPRQALPGRFLPVFWSPIWFPQQVPNTMGILCDPKHPALAQFPTEFYSNWQWYDLVQNSRSLILDSAPGEFRPIVQVIDNFARNHKLGCLLEARVGPGRLLVSTIDLAGLAPRQPAAAQLLRSLYAYASSEAFAPKQQLAEDYLDQLLTPPPADKGK